MADMRTLATPGSQDLVKFQEVVKENEQIIGPLTALSSAQGVNLMTFEVGALPDDDHVAQLATYTGAQPPAKDGSVVVCTGTCLVANAVQQVVAYRKTP